MSSTKPWTRFGGAAGLVASGLIADGVLAGTFTASAAEGTATTGAESSTSQSAGEELLTGDTETQVLDHVLGLDRLPTTPGQAATVRRAV
jgi:hypothetical protein